MAGDNPALIVRVAANIEDLKKGLSEGRTQIDTTVAAAIGLQTKLVLAESAARAAGVAMRTMADAIAQSGTATEAQVGALAHATAQFLAMKGAVAAARDELASLKPAAETSTNAMGNLRGSLNQFDGVLAAMGVHMGPEIRGLGELGDASGKTASQVGLLGVAGLAFGAAIGGWKIGRLISDFFGLDDVIGQATAKLLGWGDAAGEAAGAKQDVVTRAIERGAAASISYADALAFNTEWFAKHQAGAAADKVIVDQLAKDTEAAGKIAEAAAAKAAAAEAHWADVMQELDSAGQSWKATVDMIDGSVVDAIKNYLGAGVSQKVLAEAYGLTAAQIKAVDSARKDEITTMAAEKKAADDWAATLTAVQVGTMSLEERINSIDGSIVDWAEHLLQSGVDAKTVAAYYGLTDDQVKALQEDLQTAVPAVEALGDAFDDSGEKADDFAAACKKAADANDALNKSLTHINTYNASNFDQMLQAETGHWLEGANYGATFGGGGNAGSRLMLKGGTPISATEAAERGYGFQEIVAAIKGGALAAKPQGPRIPGFAGGVEDFAGGLAMVGERGPEVMYVPPHASITPHGTSVGGGGAQIIQLVVDGRVLAAVVTDHQAKTLKRSRQWPSA